MAARATEIVEIGTLTGYSAVWMAHALLSDGRVRTIEKSPRHADFVERWISKSDVAHKVEVYRGDAAEILPAFHADSADAALIDANKEGRPLFLREIMRIVRRGGLGIADNAFGFGRILDKTDTGASSMRAINDIMSKETGLRSIIVPVGDEPWLGLKM
jgi:caffeoyl-CoA O-methyltransferase